MKILIIPLFLIMLIPVAFALEKEPEINPLEIVKAENYDEQVLSKNYTCKSEIIEQNGVHVIYHSCEKKYDECVLESYLENGMNGYERKYQCEPNYRVDYYFILPLDEKNGDEIHVKSLELKSIKDTKYDNFDFESIESGNQKIVSGSFEYDDQTDMNNVKQEISNVVDADKIIYGQIQIFKSWHHIKDANLGCEIIDEIIFGVHPEFG